MKELTAADFAKIGAKIAKELCLPADWVTQHIADCVNQDSLVAAYADTTSGKVGSGSLAFSKSRRRARAAAI